MSDPVQFYINDKPVKATAQDSDMSLVDFLHERQDLTATKFCCGIGVCRACTVATRNYPGAPLEKTLACSTPVSFLDGVRVYTVEGLSSCSETLSPLQQAFLDAFSFQCGYCTSGFLMAATAMIDHIKAHQISAEELDYTIYTWVGGNICRCTGYVRYMDAIRKVALPYTRGGQS